MRDPKNYEKFKQEVAEANIFIGSLIFVQELADKVVEAVEPNREKLDAVILGAIGKVAQLESPDLSLIFQNGETQSHELSREQRGERSHRQFWSLQPPPICPRVC